MTSGPRVREEMEKRLGELPGQTRWATRQMLTQLDSVSEQIGQFEKRLEESVEVTPEMTAGARRAEGLGDGREVKERRNGTCQARSRRTARKMHAPD